MLGAAFVMGLVAVSAPAQAAHPGENGAIAYEDGRQLRYVDTAGDEHELEEDASLEFTPAYSADGRRVAYVLSGNLLIADADGTDRALVAEPDDTLGGVIRSPTWSPDGQRIAYIRFDDPDTTGDQPESTVVIRSLAGAPGPDGEIRLFGGVDYEYSDASVAWSPDGSRLAFAQAPNSDSNSDVWTISAEGGAPVNRTATLVRGAYDPDWSPDGRRIVFDAAEIESPTVVMVMNADGTDRREIATGWDPVWSPDGSRVALIRRNTSITELATADPDGPSDQTLASLGTEATAAPAWQPVDGVAPAVDVAVPAEGARYRLGDPIAAEYSCADPRPAGSGVLDECSGTVASGAPIDTSTAGDKTFVARARDRMGNVTVVSRQYTVTDPPRLPRPEVRILAGPTGRTYSRRARFTFTANVTDATFACRVDGKEWRRCTGDGVHVVRRASVGKHVFAVRATDPVSRSQSSPARRRWRVALRPLAANMRITAFYRRIEVPSDRLWFVRLAVLNVPAKATIRVTCRGGGCHIDRSAHFMRSHDSVALASWLPQNGLRPGSAVDVRVTKRGYRGIGVTYCIRQGRKWTKLLYTTDERRPRCSRASGSGM